MSLAVLREDSPIGAGAGLAGPLARFKSLV